MSDESDGEDNGGITERGGHDALSVAADPKNEEKLLEFLDNPEKTIKVFMSSYSWAKGYVWYLFHLHSQRLGSRLITFQVGT